MDLQSDGMDGRGDPGLRLHLAGEAGDVPGSMSRCRSRDGKVYRGFLVADAGYYYCCSVADAGCYCCCSVADAGCYYCCFVAGACCLSFRRGEWGARWRRCPGMDVGLNCCCRRGAMLRSVASCPMGGTQGLQGLRVAMRCLQGVSQRVAMPADFSTVCCGSEHFFVIHELR